MASASFCRENGPTCTWKSASPGTLFTTITGYCFLRKALTSASASLCLLTAATCTMMPLAGRTVSDGLLPVAGVEVLDVLVAEVVVVGNEEAEFVVAGAVVDAFLSVGLSLVKLSSSVVE